MDMTDTDCKPNSRSWPVRRSRLTQATMQRLKGRLKTLGKQLRRDVWSDPTIRPVTAIVLSALAGLVIWLTATYASGAASRASSASVTGAADAIPPQWGQATIGMVIVLTLFVGFQAILERRRVLWWRNKGQPLYRALSTPIRILLYSVAFVFFAPIRLASVGLSFVDFLLARPIAILAGAGWRGGTRRYGHFVLLMATIVVVALQGRPAVASGAVIAGLIAILGIVRRWSWIEADRNTFLIERGERTMGLGSIRIGFREDLRDEALFALACLFFLIPLGLDAVQQTSCAAGGCAFSFDARSAMPTGQLDRFVVWAGYFGAELAKTVPFVDWSEVFHVANGSPLRPLTPFGSQVAFVLRAGLDLLFLAAVLQAVQIATRLREQEFAFLSNRLPILEPFSERRKLLDLASMMNGDLDIRPSEQSAVLDFPNYELERLMELVEGIAGAKDHKIREAAAALLQAQFEQSPDRFPDTSVFWTRRLHSKMGEIDPDFRPFLRGVASGLDPSDILPRDRDQNERLLQLGRDEGADARSRAEALRTLGRAGVNPRESETILGIVRSHKNSIDVRAAGAVALAKTGDQHFSQAIADLADVLPDMQDAVPAACATAYALAWMDLSPEDVASQFKAQSLRGHARTAALVQRQPMSCSQAAAKKIGVGTNQTVRISPGSDGFPQKFDMGSRRGEEGSEPSERPLRRGVAMTRSFALGRYTVTSGEYSAHLAATRRQDETDRSDLRTPATWLSWHEALAYCRWLNSFTGERYRLPSEAEWEYACRAGTDTRYSWGDEWDKSKARSNETNPDGRDKVGSYRPNAWGLWDMHGNVYEWCADPWHPNFRGAPPKDDRVWVDDADCSLRIIRGGSGSSASQRLRSAFRYGDFSTFRYHFVGFRLARTLPTDLAF